MKALIVLPTYNEVENLRPLWEAIQAQVPDISLLVVDDHSPDGTGQEADRLAQENPRVHVLHREGKLGLGTAYLAGFRWALERDFDPILEMDADFSHDPGHLPAILASSGAADLVLGSRYTVGGGTANWSWARRMLSLGGNTYARIMLDLPYTDLTGGFKCFRRRVLEAIPLDEIHSEGYGFQVEMTWRALNAGFRVMELPITFHERRVGQSKISRRIVLEALALVARLRWEKSRNG